VVASLIVTICFTVSIALPELKGYDDNRRKEKLMKLMKLLHEAVVMAEEREKRSEVFLLEKRLYSRGSKRGLIGHSTQGHLPNDPMTQELGLLHMSSSNLESGIVDRINAGKS
jgi:hypothetical protein